MKPKFPRQAALDATREILATLRPGCARVIVAGSLRRRREEVGDIEILYIARMTEREKDGTFWEREQVNLADEAICYDTAPAKLPGWLECYGTNAGDAACITIKIDGANTTTQVGP